DRGPAAAAGLALAAVDLEVVLVVAGLAVEVDEGGVLEAGAAVLHRLVEGLDEGSEQAADLLAGELAGDAVVAEAGLVEDVVAVDRTDPGHDLRVHEERLQLGGAGQDEPGEGGPGH